MRFLPAAPAIWARDNGNSPQKKIKVYGSMSNVVTKNSDYGTCYCEYCRECKKYPCKTGIVSFVLIADGYLELCNKIQLDVKGY